MSKKKKKERKMKLRQKVQKRFKAREAAGLSGTTGQQKGTKTNLNKYKRGLPDTSTMGIYRKSQRDRIESNARSRLKSFKAERLGLDSARLGAEATRLTGIPSGDKLRPGMLTFSDQGRLQADKNKAEAQAKKARQFDTRRLYSMDKSPFSSLKGLETFQNVGYRPSFTKPGNQMRFGIPYTDPGRTGSMGTFGNFFDKGVNMRVPNEATASIGRVIGDDFSQMGKFVNPKTGKLETGLFGTPIPKNFNQLKQTFQGEGGFGFSFGKGVDTGPTAATRVLTRRFLPYVGQISLGKDIFNYGGSEQLSNFADSTIGKINPYAGTAGTDRFSTEAAAARERGPLLSIGGFKVPEFGLSEYMGINTATRGPKDTRMATIDAGGLNLGNQTPTVKGDPTGRTLSNRLLGGIDAIMRDTTDFDGLGVGNPASFGLGNTNVGKVLNAAANETGTINKLRTETNNFQNLTPNKFNGLSNADKVKTVQSVLRFTNDSQAAQALGESLGLGKDFKTKINNLATDIQGRTKGVTADRDSLYNVTSQFAKDIGTDTDLKPLNQFLTARSIDNLGKVEGEKTAKIFGINNPLGITNEMARDIKAAFQDDSPTTKGLSKEERGVIGQIGNRFLAGKGTDALREASYGYGNKPAVNAGVTEGAPMNFTDMLNTGLALQKNLKGDTLAARRLAESRRLIDGRDITAGSLIRGLIPRGGRRSFSRTQNPVGSRPAAPELLEELLINQTQTPTQTPTQTAGDAGNLAAIQQQAYLNALGSYGIDPNLFARIQERQLRQMNNPFRNTFIRNYF